MRLLDGIDLPLSKVLNLNTTSGNLHSFTATLIESGLVLGLTSRIFQREFSYPKVLISVALICIPAEWMSIADDTSMYLQLHLLFRKQIAIFQTILLGFPRKGFLFIGKHLQPTLTVDVSINELTG